MKRNDLAVILGLALAVSSTAVYAEEAAKIVTQAETEEETATQAETENKIGGQGNMGGPGGNAQQPPEKPEGEGTGAGSMQQPPEKPEGEKAGAGEMQQPPEMPGGMGGPGGMGAQGVDSYDAVTTLEEDTEISGESIESTGKDENALHVTNGAKVSVEDTKVSRISSESTGGDNASFYGVGAAILATDGTAVVKNSEITTDAGGGAGIFAYGDGTAYVEDCTIETQQDTSGGVHVAGGGTLYAWNTTAVTNGGSAAAVRSDRGGGKMVIDGGSFTSNGYGSPAVYCTADIAIHDAKLTATGSEAVCIEGLNTLRLYDCSLSGKMTDDGQNDNTWTVIVYQSMSGDSEEGNGTFQMKGGRLTSGNGGIFYTTNTESTLTLSSVEIEYPEDSEFFLQCTGNSNARGWGQAGENGADCTFTGIGQQMQGDVIWDSISKLDFYMTQGSILTGAFRQDEIWAGEGGDGYCNVIISEDSEWIVTGDSRVSTLSVSGTVVDETGMAVTVMGTDGTVYAEGDSEYTITVDNYNDTADVSGAGEVDNWEDHAVEML